MRLSKGTIALIVVALVVIVAVLVFNASPASAPPSPTATLGSASAGPLFPGLDATTIAALTVNAPASGQTANYRRGSDGAWTLDGDETGYSLDGKSLDDQMTALAGLASFDTFSSDRLADYGLDAPIGVITVQTADGATLRLVIGGTNPTGNRRYVVALTGGPEATPEATANADATAEAAAPLLTGAQSVSTVVSSTVQDWLDLLTMPPYQPTATPVPTQAPTPTPEATAEASAEALSISTPIVEPTAEVTSPAS